MCVYRDDYVKCTGWLTAPGSTGTLWKQGDLLAG